MAKEKRGGHLMKLIFVFSEGSLILRQTQLERCLEFTVKELE